MSVAGRPRARPGLLTWLAALIAVVAFGAAGWLYAGSGTDDPLGPYPLQTVTNRVPGVQGPAAHYGEAIVVEGVLCSKRSVDVRTTLSWQSVDASGTEHTGTFFTVANDVPQHRRKGCERHVAAEGTAFINAMPDSVIAADQLLRAHGAGSYWVIQGFEVPLLDHGDEGRRALFFTQVFQLVGADAAQPVPDAGVPQIAVGRPNASPGALPAGTPTVSAAGTPVAPSAGRVNSPAATPTPAPAPAASPAPTPTQAPAAPASPPPTSCVLPSPVPCATLPNLGL